jgi:eukaryotic-like serine/threonine-protein kinase
MESSDSNRKASASPIEPMPLFAVPDHQLIRLIGSGGGGEVWLAKNALGTYRAVKIVHKRTLKSEHPFNQEFNGVLKSEPISRLHDGMVDILQVGGSDAAGYFYYVMELADAVATGQTIIPDTYMPRTLAYDLGKRRRLPIGECVRLGAAIASALSFLHRHDLIHRDIKPSNIVFVNGFPKLADIGLVTHTFESRSYVGTEGFIPPEGSGTPRADIYSLGKVLYEISTGKDRNDYPELPELKNTAEDVDLIQFNKIVLKACRANPRLRYNSAEELMAALLAFQFCRHGPRTEQILQTSYKIIAIIGAVVGASIITILIWRIIWLLKHGS